MDLWYLGTKIVSGGNTMNNTAARLLQFGVALLAVAVPAFAGLTAPTPEPATVLMIGGGLGALILIARRKRSKK